MPSAPAKVAATHSGPAPHFDARTLAPITQGVVVRHAALHVDGASSSFRAVLQPQSLGEVVVHVQRAAGALQITITPQHAETGALLDRHMPELLASLRVADVGPVQASVAGWPSGATASGPAPSAPPAHVPQGTFGGQAFSAGTGGGQSFEGRQAAADWIAQAPVGAPRATGGAGSAVTLAQRAPSRTMPRALARIDFQA